MLVLRLENFFLNLNSFCMVVLKLTLDLYGKSFIPTKLVELINDEIFVNYIDNSYNFVSLEKPFSLGINQDLLAYEMWYVEFINKYYTKLLDFGVERIDLFINVFFHGQCNFEIFTNNMLRDLTKRNISLPISIFKLSQAEIKSLLSDYKYSDSQIKYYFKEEPC